MATGRGVSHTPGATARAFDWSRWAYAIRPYGRLALGRLGDAVGRRLSDERRRRLRQRAQRLRRPALLGTLRGRAPLSDHWGWDRGTPIDRYYIERFLEAHRADIRGLVLEVRDDAYARRFGSAVERIDILDIDPANPRATIVTDLAAADAVQGEQFDCFILTQTLQFIYESASAIRHAHRLLRPGGVLLVTVSSISRINPRDGLVGDFWRFTPASCRALFGDVFGSQHVGVWTYGSADSAIAFLAGLSHEEIGRARREAHDPYFPVIVAVRAVKVVR